MKQNTRGVIIGAFVLLSVISVLQLFNLKFSFSLDQFFPEGDEDLEFFKSFTKDFESDINFLLVAVERKDGVFDQQFLQQFHNFTLKARDLPYVVESQSLTKFSYPLKTPFAITSIPAIHIDQPEKYDKDKARILKDERFVGNLISEDATAIVVAIKTVDTVLIDESKILVTALDSLVNTYDFEDYHMLGTSYFQKEMVEMQKREIIVSSSVSALLVSIVMFMIFRKPLGIAVALVSIGLGMLLFLGFLGLAGRELNVMSALYPVLMIIVGTSDVIHIMSKYIDELRKGLSKKEAIRITIKEIGLATLLTSITTAIGFATLATSKVIPIKDFGINSAVGVIIAYLTVIFFTTAMLSMFNTDQLIKLGRGQAFWERSMQWMYDFTKKYPRQIAIGISATILICLYGLSLVTTNYRLESNLPKGAKISKDFVFFEEEFAGFRPLELAVFVQGNYTTDDFEVLQQIDKVEQKLAANPHIMSINSITSLYKSINQMHKANRPEAYHLPDQKSTFVKYQRMSDRVPTSAMKILVSEDKKKARITSRIKDLGADSIRIVESLLENWLIENTDPNIVQFKITGTGMILDKNADYIRKNLIEGLGIAVLIVSLLMVLLFRNIKMILISLIPNILPLLIAGALLGYLGIELEAGVSILFAIIFGIAVDDTIHFLSKYKLARNAGKDMEQALHITFLETGKAICLTSLILFFGFLVMLFSIHPPSITVGMMISVTLLSALLSDMLIIPVLIRWMM